MVWRSKNLDAPRMDVARTPGSIRRRRSSPRSRWRATLLRFDLGTSTIRRAAWWTSSHWQLTGLGANHLDAGAARLSAVIAMIPRRQSRLGLERTRVRPRFGDAGSARREGRPDRLAAARLESHQRRAGELGRADRPAAPGDVQGAPLISLQTVLSLTTVRSRCSDALTADGSQQTFLLMLDEIALSFLGL